MEVAVVDDPLPIHKLSLPQPPHSSGEGVAINRNQISVVLVSTGSFNPPTYMHLRMFELGRDALNSRGHSAIGGYMSPVNDGYKKKGLLPATYRVKMCELACESSSFIMVDHWEAKQSNFQRTVTVLTRIQSSLCLGGLIRKESLKVMLLCGSDLLESFGIPGVWIPDQVSKECLVVPLWHAGITIRTICKDFGIVCIRREGKDIENIISSNVILSEFKSNIISVDEMVPNQISSTRVRECIRRGLSVKYLTADEVIDYIKDQMLYIEADDNS